MNLADHFAEAAFYVGAATILYHAIPGMFRRYGRHTWQRAWLDGRREQPQDATPEQWAGAHRAGAHR